MLNPRRGLRPAVSQSKGCTSIETIWIKYERLCLLRAEALELAVDIGDQSHWSFPHSQVRERMIDPIETSIAELAWMSVHIPATNAQDIERKTKILGDCAMYQSGELITALANSLMADMD